MPALLDQTRRPTRAPADERLARAELRRQIAALESELGSLFTSSFPRRDIEWRVGAVGGPRVLELAELERIRDALVFRIGEVRSELARRAGAEEANRALLDEMIAEPARYRWLRISNDDVGEPGCRHWHSRPRWGLLGMLLGWWRVKLSSGCPLAEGLRPRPAHEHEEATQAAPARRRPGSAPAGGRREHGGRGGP